IGKFCQEDREIFHIGGHWLPIMACALRHKGSRHTDHPRNRANHTMAEIDPVSTHIADLARSRQGTVLTPTQIYLRNILNACYAQVSWQPDCPLSHKMPQIAHGRYE